MDLKEDSFHLGVKALILNTKNKLLLLQKNLKKGIVWDLPGGRIQKHESLQDTLHREVYEETGLKNLSRINPFTMVLTNARIPLQTHDVGLILAVYLCTLTDEEPTIQLSDEHLHHEWVTPQEAAALLAPNHPQELIDKVATL